jgi:hypothetical protein
VADGESARRGRADPVSLHPLSFEKAIEALAATPPIKIEKPEAPK